MMTSIKLCLLWRNLFSALSSASFQGSVIYTDICLKKFGKYYYIVTVTPARTAEEDGRVSTVVLSRYKWIVKKCSKVIVLQSDSEEEIK